MATKDCKICGKPIDTHKKIDLAACIESAGYMDYTDMSDKSALALADELKLLTGIGQPHQDKNMFELYFKGSKKPVETTDVSKTVYSMVLTKVGPPSGADTVTIKGPFKKGKSSFDAAYSSDILEDKED